MFSYQHISLLFDTVTLLIASLVGLVAIWAALGRRPPWFPRIAILGGLLSLGLAVPAHDLVLTAGLQSAVVIVALWLVWGRLNAIRPTTADGSQRARWQFSLLDLLLASVVFAAIAGFLASVPDDVWKGWEAHLLGGLLSGVCTLLAAWVVFGRRHLLIRLAALVLVSTSPFVAASLTDDIQSAWFRLVPRSAGPALVVIACWLVLFRASGFLRLWKSIDTSCAGAAVTPTRRRAAITWLARATLVSLSLAILAPLGAVYCMLINPEPIPETTLPPENGYDALAEAGQFFQRVGVPRADKDTESVLGAFVTEHQQTLDKARDALDLPCKAPLDYSMSDKLKMTSDLSLACALWAQGKLAEMEGHTADAAETYLYLVRFGHAMGRGALPFDACRGCVHERDGITALYGLRDRLTPQVCRQVIGVLASLDASRELADDALHREKVWWHHALGWQGRLIAMTSEIGDADWLGPQLLDDRIHRCQAEARLLICELGIRMYRAEHGSPPEKLADLVPHYLTVVPDDPFSERPLVYRRTSTDYLLYSVGKDRKDDGGWHVEPWESPGDLFLGEPPGNEETEAE